MVFTTRLWMILLWIGMGSVQADISVTAGDPTKLVIQGAIVIPQGMLGEMTVEHDTITCVAATCPRPLGATIYTITEAYIFPGFIDAHNHVAYNVLPKWIPPKRYVNRNQWQREKAYKAFKAPYDVLKKKKLLCEMVKYGEVKALLSGITTIQGSPPSQKCFGTLIRNAESENGLLVTDSHIRTHILDIKSAPTIDWNRTKAFVVHLSEGIDEKSRREFDTLKQKNLLTSGTAIIHGTAFGDHEFQEIAEAGAKLIWSPQSNLSLYGKTTRIDLAHQHHVPVALGVDWNPTGSNDIFDELRVASQVNEDEFQGAIPDSDWLNYLTVNPAKALALENYIGKLERGYQADLTVVRARDAEPNRSLLKSGLQDVELVMVSGNPLYGMDSVIQQDRVEVTGLRPLPLPHHRTCGFPHPAVEPGDSSCRKI
jgi:5-methylthioadenosine/S-adenosylhomocysteine deaminase